MMFPQNISLRDVVPDLKKFSQKKFDLYTQSIIFEQKQLIQNACGLILDQQKWGNNQYPIESCIRRFFQRHDINTQEQSAKPIEIGIPRLEFNSIIFKTETQLMKFLIQFSQECFKIQVKDNTFSDDYQMKFDYLIIELDQEAYKELQKSNAKLDWFRQYINKNSFLLNQQNQLQQKYRLAIQQSSIKDHSNVQIFVFQQINIALRQNLLEALNRSLTLTSENKLSAFVKQGQQIVPAQFYNQLYSDQNKLNILMKINNLQSVDNTQLMALTGKQDTKIILCEIIDTIDLASELIRWEEILDNFMENNLLARPIQNESEKSQYDSYFDRELEKFRQFIQENKQFNFQEPQLCNEDVPVEINHYIQSQKQQGQKPCVLYKITQTGIQMMCQYAKFNYVASFSFNDKPVKLIGNIAQFLTEEIDSHTFLQVQFFPQAKAKVYFKELIEQDLFQQLKQKLAVNIIHGIHSQLFRFTLNPKTIKLWEKGQRKQYEFPIPSQTLKELQL